MGKFFIIFVIAIIIFILTRKFWCWYWKINEVVDLLKDIRDRMDKESGVHRKSYAADSRPYNLPSPRSLAHEDPFRSIRED